MNAYFSSFDLTENPMSEDGRWKQGLADGLDWTNVQTGSGFAYGTQSSGGFDDSIACLNIGSWNENQMAEGIVRTINQTSTQIQEAELLLRFNISAHSATGYEFLFRCRSSGVLDIEIVRWNGTLGDFTSLGGTNAVGVSDGDRLAAVAVGPWLFAYVNGVEACRAHDTTYRTGSPGVGFYTNDSTSPPNSDWGWYEVRFTDRIVLPTIKANNETSQTTITTDTFNVPLGSSLIVGLAVADVTNTPTISSIKLDGTTSFTIDKTQSVTGGANDLAAIASLNNVAAGDHTVTATFTAAITFKTMFVVIVPSWVTAIGAASSAGSGNTGATAAISSGTFAVNKLGDLIIGCATSELGGTQTFTPDDRVAVPYGGFENDGSAHNVGLVAYILPGGISENVSGTLSSAGTWAMVATAYTTIPGYVHQKNNLRPRPFQPGIAR